VNAIHRGFLRLLGGMAWTLLAACGGGGDDEHHLPPLSQDIVPSGPRIDVSQLDLFPSGAGDSWLYDRIPALNLSGTVTRAVISGPDANGFVVLRETDVNLSTDIVQRLTPDGPEQYDPLGAEGRWPGVFTALPSFIEYPTPLYPVGGERRVIRQGSFGVDVDGDGRLDDFRVEIVQVFRGFEAMDTLGQTIDVAHFSNVLAFTTVVTSNGASYTVTTTEEAYFAGNVGLVRADRAAVGSDGAVIVAPYSIVLRSATVGGVGYGAAAGPTEKASAAASPHKGTAPWLTSAIERAMRAGARSLKRPQPTAPWRPTPALPRPSACLRHACPGSGCCSCRRSCQSGR